MESPLTMYDELTEQNLPGRYLETFPVYYVWQFYTLGKKENKFRCILCIIAIRTRSYRKYYY